MIADWVIMFVIAIAINVVSYMLMPKPKQPKPDTVKDLDDPVAEAGKPMPVIFGRPTVKGLNVLWYGDKSTDTYEIEV
jgi:hypothetical protein